MSSPLYPQVKVILVSASWVVIFICLSASLILGAESTEQETLRNVSRETFGVYGDDGERSRSVGRLRVVQCLRTDSPAALRAGLAVIGKEQS